MMMTGQIVEAHLEKKKDLKKMKLSESYDKNIFWKPF